MADYRIYRFDGASRIELAEWIEAPDDAEAVRRTHLLGMQGAKCEVWQGRRLVAAISREAIGDERRTG